MSFTNNLATDIGQMRLELGDDVSGSGVRPDGTNLSDEQLQVLLTREGSLMPAVAAACELLARNWAGVATISVGPRSEQLGTISKQWADRAVTLRAQYGGLGSGKAFSASFHRADAYAAADITDPDYGEDL